MTNFDREIIEYAEINEFDQYVDKECTFDTNSAMFPYDELLYNKGNTYYSPEHRIFDGDTILTETFRVPNFNLLFNTQYKCIVR